MIREAFAKGIHDVDDLCAGTFGLRFGQRLALALRVDELYDRRFVVVLVGGEVELRSAARDTAFQLHHAGTDDGTLGAARPHRLWRLPEGQSEARMRLNIPRGSRTPRRKIGMSEHPGPLLFRLTEAIGPLPVELVYHLPRIVALSLIRQRRATAVGDLSVQKDMLVTAEQWAGITCQLNTCRAIQRAYTALLRSPRRSHQTTPLGISSSLPQERTTAV